MKRILSILVVTTLLFSCKKEEVKNCFTIKYVDGVCADNIYEIITPEYQYLGEDNWVAAKDGKTYNNVFLLRNYCELPNLNNDSTANVYITNEDITKVCISCLAIYPKERPKVVLTIKPCN